MGYTPFQLQILAISAFTSSIIALFGSGYVLHQIYLKQSFRSELDVATKLIICMCIGEILGTIAYGQVQFHLQSPIPCQIQAVMMQFGSSVLNLSLLGLTYVLWSNVSDSYIARNFKLNFSYWITFTVLLSAGSVTYALEQHAMGPALLW